MNKHIFAISKPLTTILMILVVVYHILYGISWIHSVPNGG